MRLLVFILAGVLAAGANKLAGSRAPGFNLPDSGFKRYDLQDFRGKWVLLTFLQTSCPNCRLFARTLEGIKKKMPTNVAFLEVVLPPDTQATVAKYIEEIGVTSPVLFDQGQMAASYFNASPAKPSFDVPHVFIINPRGMIVRDFGHDDEGMVDGTRIEKDLAVLLSERVL